MGSTESDMQYGVFNTTREAAEFLSVYMTFNAVRYKYDYAAYEFTSVINGLDESDWEPCSTETNIHYGILELACEITDNKVAQHMEKQLEKKAEEERLKAERIRQQELKTLAELQEKHGKNNGKM
jgi:hypothetical protein